MEDFSSSQFEPESQFFYSGVETLINLSQPEASRQELEYNEVPPPRKENPPQENKTERLLATNLLALTNLCKILRQENKELHTNLSSLSSKLSSITLLQDTRMKSLQESFEEFDEKMDTLLSKRADRLRKDSERRRQKKVENNKVIDKEREKLRAKPY